MRCKQQNCQECYVMILIDDQGNFCGEVLRKKKAVSLVSWDTVTKPKKEGGLGLRSMRQTNVVFMAKWGWKLLTEPNTLWARVLRHKYCSGRCDMDMFACKPNSSNVWKGIVDGIPILKKG